MHPEAISPFLNEIFGSAVEILEPGSWQIDTPEFRLLVLLSEDHSWLRALTPIAPQADVESLLPELMAANFDLTQETRYALYQGVLWGVFHHSLKALDSEDFSTALARLVGLRNRGLSECYNLLIEKRIRQIIGVAKTQGQSLETTMQSLDRLYQEGMMGNLTQSRDSMEETLSAWRYQLERLWPEVEAASV
ncbi:MAG: hypothetical protein KME35_22120 [Aphanocapsa sp. GSE-SYN-MK-11-07L]|jgi:hypothetical protein|nr:hypothetical protein [Aphanocapsa sp. GSE-SYN-MK-11-07L]